MQNGLYGFLELFLYLCKKLGGLRLRSKNNESNYYHLDNKALP